MFTHASWLNFQKSCDPFELIDESNHNLSWNNQNSFSLYAWYASMQQSQQFIGHSNNHTILNSSGKNDNSITKQEKSTFEPVQRSNNFQNISDFSPQSQSQIEQSLEENKKFQTKKGLKNLAKLLIRILKKSSSNSSKCLTAEIEQKLMKGKRLSKSEYVRQSKNIRRRTYDALNVMLSANVLEQDSVFIKMISAHSLIRKQAFEFGQKNQMKSKISQLSQKLQNKKLFLKQLKSKRSALEWWINKKKKESQKLTSNEQQFLKQPQNVNSQKFQIQSNKIPLPAVFIHQIDEKTLKSIEIKSSNLVVIKPRLQQIKLFSEIDSFQILKGLSQIQKNQNQKQREKQSEYFSFKSIN